MDKKNIFDRSLDCQRLFDDNDSRTGGALDEFEEMSRHCALVVRHKHARTFGGYG
jgi:hypothetical protein